MRPKMISSQFDYQDCELFNSNESFPFWCLFIIDFFSCFYGMYCKIKFSFQRQKNGRASIKLLHTIWKRSDIVSVKCNLSYNTGEGEFHSFEYYANLYFLIWCDVFQHTQYYSISYIYGCVLFSFQPNACHVSETTLNSLTPGRYYTKPRATFEAKVSVFSSSISFLSCCKLFTWTTFSIGTCLMTSFSKNSSIVNTRNCSYERDVIKIPCYNMKLISHFYCS